MEQRYSNFDDLLNSDDGNDDIDTDTDVDEDEQPVQHVYIPVAMMHISEAKELMVWCALLVLSAFAAGAFATFAILKGAGAL